MCSVLDGAVECDAINNLESAGRGGKDRVTYGLLAGLYLLRASGSCVCVCVCVCECIQPHDYFMKML